MLIVYELQKTEEALLSFSSNLPTWGDANSNISEAVLSSAAK